MIGKNKKAYKLTEQEFHSILEESISSVLNEYLDKDYAIPLRQDLHSQNRGWALKNMHELTDVLRVEGYIDKFSEEQIMELDDASGATYGEGDSDMDTITSILDEVLGTELRDKILSDFWWYRVRYKNDWNAAIIPVGEIHNQWLIHFTNHAHEIINKGFTQGTPNKSKVAYTCWVHSNDKHYKNGYLYGYKINDIPNDATKFGEDAILFQASGIEVYHRGDKEKQVIFHNQDAKNLIYIQCPDNFPNTYQNKLKDWTVASLITDEPLYTSDSIEDVIEWILKNFSQYRKHLIHKNASKINAQTRELQSKTRKQTTEHKTNNNTQSSHVINEAMGNDFSWDEFNDILEHYGIVRVKKYCIKHLGEPIGEGSARTVFDIDDKTVLKLSLSKNNVMQNMKECNVYEKLKHNPLLPQIYGHSDDYVWVWAERVLPCYFEDFEKILGIPYNSYYKRDKETDIGFDKYKPLSRMRKKKFNDYNGEDSEFTFEHFLRWLYSYKTDQLHNYTKEENRTFKNLLKKTWFKYFLELTNHQNLFEFFDDNFGLAMRDGKPTIVVLDMGY